MTNEATTAQEVYERLLERSGEADPRPRIEPVKRLASYLGEPQLTFSVVHVAGTNGKTSTSRAIEVLLRSHGLKTGLFTSPHLISFQERIRIDGESIADMHMVEAWQEMSLALEVVDKELIAEGQSAITFFEALVVLALVAFSDAPIDVAVIEVGMGGEWDATNIVTPEVSVFTPIALDHTEILGSEIETIATTKSGIIKPGTVVVSAAQEPDAEKVLRTVAQTHDAKIYFADQDFKLTADLGAVGGRMFNAEGITGAKYEQVLLPLFGSHQSDNALLAIAAVEAFTGAERTISEDVLSDAMTNLTSPGRLQTISTNPLVLIDSAHNPHGAEKLVSAVKDHFAFEELLLVVGVLEDKDKYELVRKLSSIATKVHVTAINSSRSSVPDELSRIVTEVSPSITLDQFDSSFEALIEAYDWAAESETRAVLVAGSVLLAGEAITVADEEGW